MVFRDLKSTFHNNNSIGSNMFMCHLMDADGPGIGSHYSADEFVPVEVKFIAL